MQSGVLWWGAIMLGNKPNGSGKAAEQTAAWGQLNSVCQRRNDSDPAERGTAAARSQQDKI